MAERLLARRDLRRRVLQAHQFLRRQGRRAFYLVARNLRWRFPPLASVYLHLDRFCFSPETKSLEHCLLKRQIGFEQAAVSALCRGEDISDLPAVHIFVMLVELLLTNF